MKNVEMARMTRGPAGGVHHASCFPVPVTVSDWPRQGSHYTGPGTAVQQAMVLYTSTGHGWAVPMFKTLFFGAGLLLRQGVGEGHGHGGLDWILLCICQGEALSSSPSLNVLHHSVITVYIHFLIYIRHLSVPAAIPFPPTTPSQIHVMTCHHLP